MMEFILYVVCPVIAFLFFYFNKEDKIQNISYVKIGRRVQGYYGLCGYKWEYREVITSDYYSEPIIYLGWDVIEYFDVTVRLE